MLRNVRQAKAKKPVVVMLHGSGSSAAIFRIQTHGIAKELSKTYDLVYLDAPTPSAPGPGVLPFFAGMPSYHRWLAPNGTPLSPVQRLSELLDVARYIQAQLDDQGVKADDVTAMFGFSQGAIVALSMLSLRLAGQSAWDNLRFSVAVGAGTTGDAEQLDAIEQLMSTFSGMLGQADGKFPGHTVQAAGVRDVWYKDSKRIQTMCAKDRTKVMDYRDGHVVPRQRGEILKLARLIEQVEKDSKEIPSIREDSPEPWMQSIPPSLLEGGDIAQGMAVLAEKGIAL
ncbi:serine hydrolase-domain-containing protein [Xylariaceae sp. FL0804]|nr:serine hydrolase-domain-containing protein [Xylariaceae sp. FL0804]